jgi:hypothetical protein
MRVSGPGHLGHPQLALDAVGTLHHGFPVHAELLHDALRGEVHHIDQGDDALLLQFLDCEAQQGGADLCGAAL